MRGPLLLSLGLLACSANAAPRTDAPAAGASDPRVEAVAVSVAAGCVTRNGWRGAGGGSLLLGKARYVHTLDDGRILVSFDETPPATQDPDGLDVYVEPRAGTCERAGME